MMRCPIESDNPEVLLDYCSHTLNAEQSTLLEAHMSHCQACRGFRDAQSAVWNSLDEWRDIPVSANFDDRLYARIDAEVRKSWWQRWTSAIRPYLAGPAVPLTAGACLLVIGSYLLQSPGSPPAAVPVAGNGQVQVEQVERALDDIEMLKDLGLLDEDGGSQKM